MGSEKSRGKSYPSGIDFEEALTVFRDPLARIFDDEEHSINEEREIIVGHSMKQRLIVASFTLHGGRIRLISARKTTRLELKDYEENVHP